MTGYIQLSNRDREAVVELLSRRPEGNIILLNNIHVFGMDPGITPFHGDYFGKSDADGLIAAGAFFNLGSLFFHAVDDAALDGLAGCLEGIGRVPRFLNGPAAQVDKLVESLFAGTGRALKVEDSDLMVLRVPAGEGQVGGGARRARAQDVDEMFEMARLFEDELFGGEIEDESSLHELVVYQVQKGAASVVELGGVLVSKAEATVLEGVGAHLGGVYTRREYRGSGHSTRCMVDLCRRLLAVAPLVSLTAHKENYPAIAVYRKIGFAKVADWKTAAVISG